MCDPMEKRKAWDFAFGLNQIDGLRPSKEFLELVERAIRGEITDNDILAYLNRKYQKQDD